MRIVLIAALLCLAGCSGLYFGDNPRPDVPKENSALTTPPPLVQGPAP